MFMGRQRRAVSFVQGLSIFHPARLDTSLGEHDIASLETREDINQKGPLTLRNNRQMHPLGQGDWLRAGHVSQNRPVGLP